MKARRPIAFRFLALSSLLISALIVMVQADSYAPRPSMTSASGIWIGYAELKHANCLRLELDEDATGYFAMAELIDEKGQFLPNIGEVHRVTKWQPDGYRIKFELAPLRTGEDRVFLTNTNLAAFSMAMHLELTQGGRKSKVTLYKESELRARTEMLKEGIGAYRNKGGGK